MLGLEKKRDEIKRKIEEAQSIDNTVRAEKIRTVLDAYRSSDAPTQNALLHSVISNVQYYKEKKSKPLDFKLIFNLK